MSKCSVRRFLYNSFFVHYQEWVRAIVRPKYDCKMCNKLKKLCYISLPPFSISLAWSWKLYSVLFRIHHLSTVHNLPISWNLSQFKEYSCFYLLLTFKLMVVTVSYCIAPEVSMILVQVSRKLTFIVLLILTIFFS